MDATELRIGNTVLQGGRYEKIVTHQLIGDLASDPEQKVRAEGYKITACPLTEDDLPRMLDKSTTGEFSFSVNGLYRVSIKIEEGTIGAYIDDRCILILEHVHQLQNLHFVLTQTELPI